MIQSNLFHINYVFVYRFIMTKKGSGEKGGLLEG